MEIKYGNETLKLDLDGYCTYNDFLVYNHNKVIYNQITGEIYDQSYNSYYDFSKSLTDIIVPILASAFSTLITLPPFIFTKVPISPFEVDNSILETDAIEASASPLNPNV